MFIDYRLYTTFHSAGGFRLPIDFVVHLSEKVYSRACFGDELSGERDLFADGQREEGM